MEIQHEPGLSGKTKNGKRWINVREYLEQKEFIEKMNQDEKIFSETGTGHNLHGRSDLSDQEGQRGNSVLESEVIEALKRSPEVDISRLEVRLDGTEVHLRGEERDLEELRAMENIILSVPEITKVFFY